MNIKNKKDYFPSRDGDLAVWLENLHDKISMHATDLGLTTAQVTEMKTHCQVLKASIKIADDKKQEAKRYTDTKKETLDVNGGALRAFIAHIKTNP